MDASALVTALTARMVVAWPELAEVAQAELSVRVEWDQMALPYAVIELGAGEMFELAMDELAFAFSAGIYYVGAYVSPGPPVVLRERLETLAAGLRRDDLLLVAGQPVGQVLEVLAVDTSGELEANRILESKNAPRQAGRVDVLCIVAGVP